jgi:hypothetical protein
MTFRISTGVRNALLGKKEAITGTNISFATSGSVIAHADNGLLAAGFRPGDTIIISGSDMGHNDMITQVVSVASNGSTMVVAGALTDESAGEEIAIMTVGGKAFADIFKNYIIHGYSGSPPTSCDAAETGTLLIKLTKASGAFTPGNAENGLNFDTGNIANGILQNDSEVMSGLGLSGGNIGYYRMYDNGEVTGQSTTAKRVQGAAGVSNAQLIMPSLTIVEGATTTATSHQIVQPAN